jgi:hypothetical protein
MLVFQKDANFATKIAEICDPNIDPGINKVETLQSGKKAGCRNLYLSAAFWREADNDLKSPQSRFPAKTGVELVFV